MRPLPSIIPLLLLSAIVLTLLFLLLGTLALFAGSTIHGTTISLNLADPDTVSPVYTYLHLLDTRLGLTLKIADTPVSCCPVWSPDGSKIAFRGENGQPMIWNKHGNSIYTLGGQDFNLSPMNWSPDSREVVFSVRDGDSGKYELYRVAAEGGERTLVASFIDRDFYGDIYQAEWSPDGRYIVFAARGGRVYRLYRVNPDGEKLRQLKTEFGYNIEPVISPDGQYVAYVAGESSATDLFVMDISGNDIRQLTFSDDNEKRAVWSPDGSQLLLVTDVNPGNSSLIDIINADGSGQTRLVDTFTSFDSAPVWSPDGAHILYEVQSNSGQGAALYIMDADGSNRRLLIEDDLIFTFEAAWQPQP